MDPFSRRGGGNEPCMLFVPTVKDSRVCAVCRFPLSEHPQAPFFFLSSNNPLYASASDLPKNATIKPITKPHPCVADPQNTHNVISVQTSERPVLSRSETSAFSQYIKNSTDEGYSRRSDLSLSPQRSGNSANDNNHEDAYRLRKCNTFSSSGLVLRPKPQYLMPSNPSAEGIHSTESITHPQQNSYLSPRVDKTEERPPSQIYRKIKSKQKERSSSAPRSVSPTQLESNLSDVINRLQLKEAVPRAHNFKEILDRFQNASDQMLRQHNAQASSARGRDPSRRYTIDTIVYDKSTPYDTKAAPKAYYVSRTGNVQNDSREAFLKQKLQSPPPLTISIPTLRANARQALPERWLEIKETDIDEIPNTPVFSDSPIPPPPSKSPAVTKNGSTSELMHKLKQHSKLSVNSRRPHFGAPIESGSESVRLLDRSGKMFARNHVPSQSEIKREESPEKRNGSRRSSITVSMPIGGEALLESPVPCPPSPSRSSRPLSPSSRPPPTPVTNDRARAIEESHNQTALDHMEVLAFVAERLSEYVRRREEPLSKNRLSQLKFGDFVFKSFTPTLTKGSSLFFEAFLPRCGQSNFDVTIMIAPASQYFPLSVTRKSPGADLWCPRVIVEIEDTHGEIRKFLKDSSHLSGRMVKVYVMPRLSLLSFHSLAAHNLHKTMKAEEYERHVCFVMMQLVCALKSLQSDGVEVLSSNFREFLLAYRHTSFNPPVYVSEYPRILLLHETIGDDVEESSRDSVGVCKYALRALCTLLHHKMDNSIPPIVHRSAYSDALLQCAELLHQEKSSSLTEAKNALEYSFWVGGETLFDSEFDAKLWLEAQRANHVNYLLKTLIEDNGELLETRERLHLQFLLSVTPRSLFRSSETLRKSFC